MAQLEELSPSYFALVMATGIVSIGCYLMGLRPVGVGLFALAAEGGAVCEPGERLDCGGGGPRSGRIDSGEAGIADGGLPRFPASIGSKMVGSLSFTHQL